MEPNWKDGNKNTKHNNNGVWKMEEANEGKKAYGDGWDWTRHMECGFPKMSVEGRHLKSSQLSQDKT